jgi:hypothetical protein
MQTVRATVAVVAIVFSFDVAAGDRKGNLVRASPARRDLRLSGLGIAITTAL